MRIDKIGVIIVFFWTCLAHGGERHREKTEIKTEQGLALITPLLEGFQVNTTTLRMEEKNILRQKDVQKHLKPFLNESTKKDHIHFELRDASLKKKRSKTTTIYGKKIFFWNDTVKTNIKLRARVYSQKLPDGSYQRIKKLSDRFYLELKVKNATPDEFNVSRKYRFLIKDTVLKNLYSLDPKLPNFEKELRKIGAKIKKENPKKTDKQLEIFLRTVIKFTEIDEEFIKPLFVVTYSRKGYKFEEKYKGRKHIRKKKREEVQTVEYQITLDENIRVYEIDQETFKRKTVEKYLNKYLKKYPLFKYDEELCFIEFKSPMKAQNKSYQKHSHYYKQLQHDFFTPLFEIINTYGEYEKNKGKLASAMKALKEAEEEKEENS